VAASRQVVVILIDALGWTIAERSGFAVSQLPLRRPLETVLGYSTAAIPTILTGRWPEEHGGWAMYRLASRDRPFLTARLFASLPERFHWRARRWLARKLREEGVDAYFDLYEIPLELLPCFDLARKRSIWEAGGEAGDTLFDALERASVPYRVWNHRTPENRNFEALLEAVGGEERFLMLYTAELDALMHRVGTDHPEVRAKLEWYESWLDRILERAARRNRPVELLVISDHGMRDVERTIDLLGEIARGGWRLGHDYLAFFDATLARFWGSRSVLDEIDRFMEGIEGIERLREEEARRLHCHFPDGRFGRRIYLADPGWIILPNFLGRGPMAAMHGYHPEDDHSPGVLLARSADRPLPERLVQIRPYLLELLGVGT
jgi:hypothetical protein